MTTPREIAAYFFITEFEEDPNAEIADVPAELARGERFISAITDLLSQLENLHEDATEEEIQFIYYEVGKAYYGTEKDSLRKFFKDIYLLLFGQTAAGRIGVLTKLLGLRYFVDRIRQRLADPFSVKGNIQ